MLATATVHAGIKAHRATPRAARHGGKRHVRANAEVGETTGVVFMPIEEASTELAQVDKITQPLESMARCMLHAEAEAKLNEQINIEYNVSYIYHALSAYFGRDTVHLPNIAKFFRDASVEERDHAQKLMDYQNMRGGRVMLRSISAPTQMEFTNDDKGDALYAFELALSLEKLNYHKLMELVKVAESTGDNQMTDFVESEMLAEQVESIREYAGYVTSLRRVGKGHGVYHFDLQLGEGA